MNTTNNMLKYPDSELSGVDSMSKTANDYYRPAVLLPKGLKDSVIDRAADLGISVSSYITNLIEADLGIEINKTEYGHVGDGRRKKLISNS